MSKLLASILLVVLFASTIAAAPKKTAKPSVSRLANKRVAKHMGSHYYTQEDIEHYEKLLEDQYDIFAKEDGFELLSEQEFIHVAMGSMHLIDHPYSPEQVRSMFIALDLNQDGQLSKEEYIPVTAAFLAVTQKQMDS